jgi:hypothetical protein
MSLDLTILPEAVEDIINEYVRQLYKNDFNNVLEELSQGFIRYNPTENMNTLTGISARINANPNAQEIAQIQTDIQEIRNPFINIPHKNETLEKNEERWQKALICHREYYDFGNRDDDQKEMYYWSQLLVYKYGHQDLSGYDYDIRAEEAFGC